MQANLENAIQILLIGTSFGVCLFMLIHLVWLKRSKSSSYYLAIFFIANLCNQFDEWFWHLKIWLFAPWLTNSYIPFLYLLAPSFYLYVKHLTLINQKVHLRRELKHLLGFGVGTMMCMPYFLLDDDIKLTRLSSPPGTLDHLGLITWGPTMALFLLLPFSFAYLLVITQLLTRHLHTIKGYFSNIENRDLSWVRWSVIALVISFVVSVVRLFLPPEYSEVGWQNIVFLCFELIWLLIVGVLAVNQRPIYADSQESEVAKSNTESKDEKYQNSPMHDIDIDRIKSKLTNAMSEGIYADPNLTLRKLSDLTGVTEIRISQVLNTSMSVGFYDFVNSWRIEAACIEMRQTNANLLEIAFAVGFNSRSTFNQAFKKHMGNTPSSYRKQLSNTEYAKSNVK
ncbi:hypothetical protein C1E23_00275 [Pseudoalteromonas phenolica]|uniref:HTH araC/xylS-type domain-containing protein n=1 Tax=Pseudoalteromonas phenolica TaxID=161398 RepID=A0A4Q7IU26_9GAMM|nr:helix-turn-helix transcriptional regulator [Pseudoalteromonas phenolica]RZQ55166.1 hypothetical protein C1E23_00275 [Pseudoalteromonas phenolica]